MIPWIVCGQTPMTHGERLFNPPANTPRVMGAVILPCLVPDGYRLCITGYGVEAYDFPGTIAFMPYLGAGLTDGPTINEAAFLTAAASAGTVYINTEVWIPAGQTVNACIINGQAVDEAYVYAWQMTGKLYVDSADL